MIFGVLVPIIEIRFRNWILATYMHVFGVLEPKMEIRKMSDSVFGFSPLNVYFLVF